MKRVTFLCFLLAATVGATGSANGLDVLHFALSKSAPEADASVASPDEVRLWFTQVPQANTMTIRVIDGSEALVETGDATPDAEDGKIFSVAIDGTLAPGDYTVAWRAIGEDGHVVRGDFGFSVTLP